MPRAIAKARINMNRSKGTFPQSVYNQARKNIMLGLRQGNISKVRAVQELNKLRNVYRNVPKKRPPTTPYIPPQIHHRPPPTKIALTSSTRRRYPSSSIIRNRGLTATKRISPTIFQNWKRGKTSMNQLLKYITLRKRRHRNKPKIRRYGKIKKYKY